MLNCDDFFNVLDEYCPLELSLLQVRNGDYDNSGLIVRSHDKIQKILFSLDLSIEAVKHAKKYGADTIVTHHPAIYHPIKDINSEGETAALFFAIKNGLNVYSMHLNLDVSDEGIDQSLAEALGADEYRILFYVDSTHGYGREFRVSSISFSDFVKEVKKQFGNKIISYGKAGDRITKIASFCGGGSGYATKAVESGKTDADVIVTSDVPHHAVKYLVEKGKKLVIIPHYQAENLGFNKFFIKIKEKLENDAEVFYFSDKRFL